MSEEARKRARETLARLAARDADRELMMVEPEVDTPAEDEPTLTEQRRAYKQAAKAGGIEARLWANLESWKRARFDGLWKAFDAFKGAVMKAVADKVVGEIAGMKAAVNEHQAKAYDDLKAELLAHIADEMNSELRELRKYKQLDADQLQAAALKAMAQGFVNFRETTVNPKITALSTEIEHLRREIRELRESR
ncbi:hypothetical protein [Ensifer sp. Root558]|uniref:hypothetical protein n=1 Tax=Ensifer sp. Root558 TaxID=1736558 RepID=UPI0007140467|nr:hypothetical protein [Ensifer sp. Root558]KQZ45406.1 hypothetical protein ASD63_09545 [Ensifer sp. Root558]